MSDNESPRPTTITPQPGKRYVTRSGKVTGPIRHDNDLEYPFGAEIEDTGNPYFWTVVGSYYSDREPHPLDLVAEYVEAPQPDKCGCDHFSWCDEHRPNLPPGPDLGHEYSKEFDAPAAEPPPAGSFQSELTALINRHSLEGGSGTPDYILAGFLRQCLDAFDRATQKREEHNRA